MPGSCCRDDAPQEEVQESGEVHHRGVILHLHTLGSAGIAGAYILISGVLHIGVHEPDAGTAQAGEREAVLCSPETTACKYDFLDLSRICGFHSRKYL